VPSPLGNALASRKPGCAWWYGRSAAAEEEATSVKKSRIFVFLIRTVKNDNR
jgi:hypothetical protein